MAKKRSKRKKAGANRAQAKRQQSPERGSFPETSCADGADGIAGRGGFDFRGILRSDALAGVSYILKLWLVSRLVLTGVGVFARSWIGQVNNIANVQLLGVGSGLAWLDIWSAWDSKFYYSIADTGYLRDPNPMDPAGYSVWAFFPLYPWLVRLVGALIGDIYIGGLIVSNGALIVGAWFLYKLVEQQKNTETAKKAVLFLFLFPTAYVFSCIMTEGLFLALTVGAWYFARKGNWFFAGILGMLSAATRLVGVLMAPLLALEYLRQRKWRIKAIRPNALWLGLVPVGVLIVMVSCYYSAGHPLMFVYAQGAWSASPEYSSVNPIRAVRWALEKYLEDPFDWRTSARMGLGYGAACTVAVVGLLFWGRKRIGNLLFLWSLGMVLVPQASHIQSSYSMPRFLAVIFPICLILATIRSRSAAFYTVAVAFGLLQAMTMSLWTTGRSFAT